MVYRGTRFFYFFKIKVPTKHSLRSVFTGLISKRNGTNGKKTVKTVIGNWQILYFSLSDFTGQKLSMNSMVLVKVDP